MRSKVLSRLLATTSLVVMLALTFGVVTRARTVYSVPSDSSFKCYMDYGAITNTKSKQYEIQRDAVTNAYGLRTYKGYYTVAVGSGFNATVGDLIDVQLSTGVTLHCIIGDMKQDAHTDATNRQVPHNGNVVEFIVDRSQLNREAKLSGDISKIDGFEGYVVTVAVVGSMQVDDSKESIQTLNTNRSNYLIMAKSEIPTPEGSRLYSVEYAFGDDFNSIVCSQSFYDSVNVGDVIDYLE